ncbi:MAG: hypothetical protein ABSD67_11140 [Terracidiphilus sp.]
MLAVIAVPVYSNSIRHARETLLKEDLHILRDVIDSYTIDKKKAPRSLDDLIRSGYLKSIPEDPMTKSKDTWVSNARDAMNSLDKVGPRTCDIHSGSAEIGSDCQPYNTW